MITLKENEFRLIQKIVYESSGIALGHNKKKMVEARLLRRLRKHNLESFAHYIRLVQIEPAEKNEMINQITTNETYFFREMPHFDFLQHHVIPRFGHDTIRVWSAAASVGAEAYSIAMLMEASGKEYEVVGTDINSDVIEKAKIGLYPEKWTKHIPQRYLKMFCLKGKGDYAGQFLVDRSLTKRVRFLQSNLLERNGSLGMFQVIFLRNVLLYFDAPTKERVIENVLSNLVLGGYFIISLTENLNDVHVQGLRQVQTSVFEKV